MGYVGVYCCLEICLCLSSAPLSPPSPNYQTLQIHVSHTETHMDVVEEKPVTINPLVGFLARIGPLLAVPILASMCYAGFYLTGFVYRQTYLQRFGIPDTLFKSDAVDYFIYAYVAILETFKNWTGLISSPWVWLSIISIIVLLGGEWICLRKLPETKAAKSLSTALSRNKYIALTAAVVGLSASVTTLLLLIPLIILPLIILPAIVGVYGAHQALDRDVAIYDQGCAHPTKPKDYCHVIMDGTRIVATGFLITASNSRIAIYENSKARVVPIKDYTLETLPPKDYLALIAKEKTGSITSAKVAQPQPSNEAGSH